MRQIKFRAFVKNSPDTNVYKDNTMYDWDAVVDDCNWFIKCNDLQEDSFILMQFTGLLDRHGKEIYEGDIVMYNDSGYTEFGFGKVTGQVVWVDCSFEVSLINPKSDTFWDLENNERWEIIGSVYENKELLKSA